MAVRKSVTTQKKKQGTAPRKTAARRKLSPDHILQLGLAFWGSKVLLSAVELGVFTELSRKSLDAETLRTRLQLHSRGARDFFDALVALGLLERTGKRYANTAETDFFLDRGKPSYMGGLLEMANARLYPFWGLLTEGLRSGEPQNEVKNGGDAFAVLYSDPERHRGFLQAMTGISMGAAQSIARRFPFAKYKTFVDIGTAQGGLPVQIALAHKHLSGTGFDLPACEPHFREYVQAFGLGHRLQFQAGDFMKEGLPGADVLIAGHILHDWNMEEKRMLIRKAHEALPPGGVFLVYDAMIDDERKSPFGLLMSLNMLIETRGGFDYTGRDCCRWMREAGFKRVYVERLAGPDSMVVAIK